MRAEVFSLSSADGVFNRAVAELHAALESVAVGRRPSRLGPNQLCVVLWLQVGILNVLLGADLEHGSGNTEGWQAIVNSGERPDGQAGVFKVPHHGSSNADCPACWTNLLVAKPIVIVTPYAPSNLPASQEIARLCTRTQHVYLTSDPAHYRLPLREQASRRKDAA